MSKIIPKIFFALVATLFLVSPDASAINSINVQTFNPSTSDHFVFLEDGFHSEWPKVAKYYFGANYNYMSDPLVVLDPTQTTKAYNVITSIQTLDLFFGFKAANNLALFFGAPIHFINFSPTVPPPFQTGNQTGFGDLKLQAKIRITDDNSNTSVALIPEIHLPTGSTQYFVSDASAYIGIRAAIERQFDAFTLIGNVGFAAAANAIYQDVNFANGIDYRKRFIVGIGGFLPFNSDWGMNAEFNNISMLPIDKAVNPNDAYLGLRYTGTPSTAYTFGASIGKIGGPSGNDFRIVAGIRSTVFEDKNQNTQPLPYASATPWPSATPLPNQLPMQPVSSTNAAVIDSNNRAVMHTNRIEVLRTITFENDSYRLLPDSRQTLDDVSSLMLKHQTAYKKMYIDGHTSEPGTDQYNLRLSIARARAVKTYLMSKGVPGSVLASRGFGKRSPKIATNTPKAAETNRRVEFIIVK